MQFELSVSEENKTILIAASGELNLQDMLDSIGAMSADPNVQSGYGVIVDLRQVNGALSLNELRTLVGEHRKYLKLYRFIYRYPLKGELEKPALAERHGSTHGGVEAAGAGGGE